MLRFKAPLSARFSVVSFLSGKRSNPLPSCMTVGSCCDGERCVIIVRDTTLVPTNLDKARLSVPCLCVLGDQNPQVRTGHWQYFLPSNLSVIPQHIKLCQSRHTYCELPLGNTHCPFLRVDYNSCHGGDYGMDGPPSSIDACV